MFLLITSGRGPVECQLEVKLIVDAMTREATDLGLKADLIDQNEGSHGLHSAYVSVTGDGADAFAESWRGSILWVCKSTIRPNHGRKNWFAGVQVIPDLPEMTEIKDKDLRFDTMTAGGAGGQHQNKTESAVRVTHIPTGISCTSRDERSQHQNRKTAIARLCRALYEREQAELEKADKSKWDHHNNLERGNPVRKYEGEKFKRVV